MTLTLTIVRHGDTFHADEPPRRIGVRTDRALTPNGEAQARALGRLFAGQARAFDRVLVSPLRRARRTAELILDALPFRPPSECRAWLAEIDHGPDEDQPEEKVAARIGLPALARWNEALEPPPDWIVDAPMRMAGWRHILSGSEGHSLLVTSAGAARFALHADAALAAQAAMLASAKLRTGAWGRIVVTDGHAVIETWNERPEPAHGG